MEADKRKPEDDGDSGGKREKALEQDDGVKTEEPKDEEVEEFYAIMRRIHVAVRYFKERDHRDHRKSAAAPSITGSSLSFQTENFGGVKKEPEGNPNIDLDLNSDPPTDEATDMDLNSR